MKYTLLIFLSLLLYSPTIIAQEATEASREIFQVVEEMPTFPGCETEPDKRKRQDCANVRMNQYIFSKMSYKGKNRKGKNKAMLIVRFIVNKEGHIESPQIVGKKGEAGVTSEMETSALEVIQNMPTWNPGRQRGRAVDTYFNLPVRIRYN